MANKWYVITGGPSTGKTTLLAELEKLGHDIVPEAARAVIDEGISKGLTSKQIRADEKIFQDLVLQKKLDTEKARDPRVLTFFDRGMHDTLAYLEAFGHEVNDELRNVVNKSRYKKVFLLEPLPRFMRDYARTEDKATIARLNELLYNTYHSAGMEVIRLPAVGLEKRVKLVLDNL